MNDRSESDEHAQFRATVRRFVGEHLRPRAREFDAAGCLDKKLYRTMGELGMLGLRYDEPFGGSNLDWSFSAILHDELGRCDNAGVALGIAVHTDMATPSLAEFGSAELKERFLVPAIRGEQVSAVAVTEPDAGSDVARIQTRAVRSGDDWVINGSKIYITNAATADWLCLLAVNDVGAGYAGFSQIIVPTDLPGVRVALLDKIGNKGSDTGLFHFDDVVVPVENTIGRIGRGFQQQMAQFQHERLVGALSAISQAEFVLETTAGWTSERILFDAPLIDMQNTQFKLVELRIQLAAARALLQQCVDQMVAEEDATDLISMAKLFCCRVAREVGDTCIQLHGGYGYMTESHAGRYFVDSRLWSIGGGSDETMLGYLAKRLGYQPRRD